MWCMFLWLVICCFFFFLISNCVHCLLSCFFAPLILSILLSPSGIYAHWLNPAVPSIPQAEQHKYSQIFPVCQTLRVLYHRHVPSLDSLSCVFMFLLYCGAHNWMPAETRRISAGLRWEEGSPPLTCWQSLPNAAQDTAGHLWCKNTLPAHG